MKLLVDTSIWSLALMRKANVLNKEALTLKTIIDRGKTFIFWGLYFRRSSRA